MNRLILTIIAFLTIISVSGQVKLETKSFFDNKVELKIPENFELMSEELLLKKYPGQQRPSLVYTDETGGINVALSYTASKADQGMLLSYKNYLSKTFKSSQPIAEWLGEEIKTINGRKVVYFNFISKAIDTDIYNLIFMTDVDGKLLICTFNCTRKNIDSWKDTAYQIMNSLTVK